MQFFRRYHRDENGIAATEFALIAPVLLLLLVGMIDFGLYINANMKLENTTRAAAEYVYQGGDPDLLENDVLSEILDPVSYENTSIVTEYICACSDGISISCGESCDSGDYLRRFIEIRLNRAYEPMFKYPGLPHPVQLNGHVRLQVQGDNS